MRKGRFAGFSMGAAQAAGPASRGRGRVPVAIAVCAPALVAAVAAVSSGPVFIIAAAIGAALVSWLALAGWTHEIETVPQPLPESAERASRLLDDFEQSGSGWFWETNADGMLSYVSASLVQALGREESQLIGHRFEELLLVEDEASEGTQRPTIGFHLSARFPFSGVTVSPNGHKELCWSVSGRPVFDGVGRFLGFRGMALQLTEQQRTAVNSSRLATSDSLTGLPNRARMRAMLDEALRNSDSRKEGCGLLLIDLDRFKQVNDTLGHPVGDLLLKEVAQRMSTTIGAEGQVGRLGGDEFETLLPGIDEEGRLAALAERLIGKISAPYVIRGHTITIGASVGIAISRPGKTLADALIKEADLALYAAKRAGRGTFRFFEPEMHAQESERQILENDLQSAVSKGQLRLAYQPIVSAATEDLVGFEALLRWVHPVRGPLAPAEFLSLAEGSGVIAGIGEWVIRTACTDAAKWPAHLRLTVNVSPVQLEQPGLTSTIASALAAAQLDPERLELDLVERVFSAQSPGTGATIAALKALGVGLALDDFGNGSSSLVALASPALDRVKLHQSALRSASAGQARLEALLMAIGGLDLDVTAEGAETLEDLALIRRLGCGEIQGFLFGRPMDASEALELAGQSAPVSACETLQSRPPRHSLIRRATMSWKGGNFSVRLRNISADGAMIETPNELEKGAKVELDLTGGIRLVGEVRWSQSGRIGLKFAESFDLQRLGSAKRETPSAFIPDYLTTETSPNSPWAARSERLTIKDVRGK
jgi:diguanylate cyclase (GGDEF)-like protein